MPARPPIPVGAGEKLVFPTSPAEFDEWDRHMALRRRWGLSADDPPGIDLAPGDLSGRPRFIPHREVSKRAAVDARWPFWKGLGLKGAGMGAASPTFNRAMRFGVIDNGILVLSSLMGFSLDDKIAKMVGQKGYGAIVGATVGNAISDAVAGLPEGKDFALGVGLGALLPIVPILGAMALRKPLKGTTGTVVTLASLGLLAWSFTKR